ncbi:MAG TPA: endonuclease V [Chloroflexi bacterium]|nr:endonuclease V [Chloroflexota bacterium]
MKITPLHSWDVTPKEAAEIQRNLSGTLDLRDGLRLDNIRTVAGVDNAYSGRGRAAIAYAVVVILSFPTLEVIETRAQVQPVTFPYVPGLLSFREGPAVVAAFEQVENRPDVILFDAQGIAHPRRFGAAAHLGLVLGLPSIGCAKSRLIGEYAEPGDTFGDRSPLCIDGEAVGAAVRTRPGHTPLFVSPGNRVSIETAIAITLACCRDGRFMPEPTRLADRLAATTKRDGTIGFGAR